MHSIFSKNSSATSFIKPIKKANSKPLSALTKTLLFSSLSTLLFACSSVTSTLPSESNQAATTATINNDATQNKQSSTANDPYKTDATRHEYRLENGLQVIIKEDHRSPVAMTQIWYKVGSADEPEDKGGISHLLEHMMFKGTEKVSGTDFDRLIAKFGGLHNAFTGYDFTGYYEMFPVNHLGLALELEADRMVNLKFDSPEFINEFSKEREVVMEERRWRTDGTPLARAAEKFRKMALPDSPKGESVIGPMTEIQNINIDDLRAWYNTWYAPNNATVVIVGDVNPEEALAQVKRYFGQLEPKKQPPRPSVAQKGMRGYEQQTLKENVKVPTLFMAFNVPTLPRLLEQKQPDKLAYDLMMVQQVLNGGATSNLQKNLVRQQGLLTSVDASYGAIDRGDGLFFISATPREGVSLQQAQDAILTEINKIKHEPIEQAALDRARISAVTDTIFSQDSVAGQAQTIGAFQAIGLDDRISQQLPQKIATVSSKDINTAASKYLVKDNLTVMYIEPNENN